MSKKLQIIGMNYNREIFCTKEEMQTGLIESGYSQSADSILEAFGIEPAAQAKFDTDTRGRGHYLYPLYLVHAAVAAINAFNAAR